MLLGLSKKSQPRHFSMIIMGQQHATSKLSYQIEMETKKNIFFFPLGGTHLEFFRPVIEEAIARGHNVTITVIEPSLLKAMAVLGPATSFLHFNSFPGNFSVSDDVLKNFWQVPDSFDSTHGAMVISHLYGFIKDAQPYLDKFLLENIAYCDLVVADAFQLSVLDVAANHRIPAASITVYAPLFAPPPLPFFPLHSQSGIEKVTGFSWFKAVDTALETVLLSANVQAFGQLYYGYPRHLFSALFAHPILHAGKLVQQVHPLPRSFIPLGNMKKSNTAVASVRQGAMHDAQEAIEKLLKRPHQMILASFGTMARVPLAAADKFCAAFTMVMGEGGADAAIFAFRPLQNELEQYSLSHDDCMPNVNEILYSPMKKHPGLPHCNMDDRIHLTNWVKQPQLLSSGQVAFFVSHGGFNSLQEAMKGEVPVAVMGLFGDQPSNADAIAHMGLGVALGRQMSVDEIAIQLLTLSNVTGKGHRDEYVQRLRSYSHVEQVLYGNGGAGRAMDLLELMAAEGYDNTLQRLVPWPWSTYALSSDQQPSIHVASLGSFLVLALWVMILLSFLKSIFWLSNKLAKWLFVPLLRGLDTIVKKHVDRTERAITN